MDNMESIKELRHFLKSTFGEDFISDQQKKLKQPPLSKAPGNGEKIKLTRDFSGCIVQNDYAALVNNRISSRKFTKKPLTLDQVAFLLWSTQGVKSVSEDGYRTTRTVPSAGARHPLETYVAAFNIQGLSKAIYHYLPFTHELESVGTELHENRLAKALNGQHWAVKAGAVFIYSAIPYRTEWRYSIDAHKLILLDAGHAAQNLCLSAHAIGCGSCVIAAYDQRSLDDLLGFDGDEEFSVYAAAAGTVE